MSGAGTPTQFPPLGPVSLKQVIGSYIYEQYNDDDNLVTFANAYNVMAQWWMDWFVNANLPLWPYQFGGLLDWIAGGIYGLLRPTLSYSQPVVLAGYATAPYNTIAYDEATIIAGSTFLLVNDDVFQRIITWHVFKGYGPQYTTRWLKRRVHRFLNGNAGMLADNDTTADVSVRYDGTTVTINVPTSDIGRIFQFAIADGVLALPFEYTYVVGLT